MTDDYTAYLQDKVQRLTLAGDALATALNALDRPGVPELIRLWDEAKKAGERP